jgi:hypothetical protein
MAGRAMTDRRKAIAYIRTSTKRQVLSLDAQRNAIECWASLAGVDVVAWHTDHGVSGALPMGKRAGLSAAMGTITDNENISILVAAHRDRLTRDMGSSREIFAQLSLCEVEFIAVDETIADSAASKFRQRTLASLGEYEANIRRKAAEPTALEYLHSQGVQMAGAAGGVVIGHAAGVRILAAVEAEARSVADLLTAKKERGQDNGQQATQPPFGYRAEGGRLVADEGEQSVIARVREARRAGVPTRDIADALRDAGITRTAGVR